MASGEYEDGGPIVLMVVCVEWVERDNPVVLWLRGIAELVIGDFGNQICDELIGALGVDDGDRESDKGS